MILPDTITYWLIAGNSGSGVTWSAPVVTSARIAQKTEQMIDNEGKTVSTSFSVYANTPIPEGAYIFIGDASGFPEPHPQARQVVNLSYNPTMSKLARMKI